MTIRTDATRATAPLKAAQELRKQGRGAEALGVLADALRRGVLDAEGIDRAGRVIAKEWPALAAGEQPLRVLLLGQCTTSWLAPSLTAIAWGARVPVAVEEGGFDNVLQDLMARPADADRPDAVILLPWNTRLLAGDRPGAERVEFEVGCWQKAWDLASRAWGCRLLQVGYDWVTPGVAGAFLGGAEGGDIDLVRQANSALRRALPPGAYFLDLEVASGGMGRDQFYDPRRYYWTKQPFSEAGTARLAEHLWGGLRALTTGPKKVVVLDLDNTLWGGVVGELGPNGVAVGEGPDGEAFRAFQTHLKGLAARGVVLAVASKNNLEDAREPFRVNPEMVLKLDDFAAFEAHWLPKATSIENVARDLNLGMDSFVFFDDNPAERELIRQALPQVEVVEAPEDPAGYVRALQAGLWFEATGLTRDDLARSAQYAVERQRRELQESFGSMDDYLRSLEMRGTVGAVDEADLARVVQLLAKTNQFNLTTRRHTRDEVAALLARPGSIGLTLRVADRFGDHGLVGVILAVPAEDAGGPPTLRIDTWLMSCRVISRTVEQFCFRELAARAAALGYGRIVGEFLPTKKNALVAGLYEDLGFARLPGDGEVIRFARDLPAAELPVTFVTAGA